MSKEIERKFLVKDDSYRAMSYKSVRIAQGYLSTDKRATVRVRIFGDESYLTVKGENRGIVRDEWEYPIPMDDAYQMLHRLVEGVAVDKTRYFVEYGGGTWEVDEFHSPVSGLVVAEIELEHPGQEFNLPPFIGDEVTGDPRYYNSNIAKTGNQPI